MINWLIDSVGNSVVGFVVGVILTWIISSRKNIRMNLEAILNYNREYRISASYLFRIKVENSYVLIKGKRINQFQPIGGVYKYYDSFKDKFDKMELRAESNSSNFYDEQDLRIYIKGKYLNQFLRWFNSRKNREYNVNREFYEELVDADILREVSFEKIKIEFIKNVTTPIHKSSHFNCKEILIYDIFDVDFMDDIIVGQLVSYAQNNDNILLVEWDNILRECITINNTSYQIGAHAKYIQ